MGQIKNQKEALAIVKQMVADGHVAQEVAEKYFPELTESEDERIRKDIATFIFNYRGEIKDRAKWIDYLGIKVSFVEKQGEQKPNDKQTHKFKKGDYIVSDSSHDCVNSFMYVNQVRPYDYLCIDLTGQKSYSVEFIDKGYHSLTVAEILYSFRKQKPEWSEEDEFMRTRCIGALGKCYMGKLPEKVTDEINWLKSLRPQSNQDFNSKILELKTFIALRWRNGKENKEKAIEMVESLRPQKQWKPSEEQIEAIEYATDLLNTYHGQEMAKNGLVLLELVKQLKAL